jgi:MoxR-like ATPase
LATQNPIESEGTYNLPEAQLDRFMFKVVVEYPDELEEERILTLHSQQVDLNQRLETEIAKVTSPEEIMQQLITNAQIRIEPALVQYINRLVRQTRNWPAFYLGRHPEPAWR